MRVLGLSLVSFVVSGAVADGFDFSKCGGEDADVGKCARKMDEVVEVTSGVSYLTKIACKDCPYAETWNEDSDDGKPESRMTHGDQELFFNVTLANDTRSVLLNGKKIFPTLATIPSPPHIPVSLLHPSFSYQNLSAATSCPDPTCSARKISPDCTAWCQTLPLGRLLADYSYAAHVQREEADAGIRYWEIVFDPVGGRSPPIAGSSGLSSPWEFDDPDRKSILVVVAGQPVTPGRKPKSHSSEDGGLFGSVGADDVFDLEITKVEQVMRRFNFATPRLTLWGKLKRFFGGDVWKEEGELVYLSAEWGLWGKRGTLRNLVGEIFHSTFLGLFFIILGSLVGGFIALRLLQSLYFIIKRQTGLARWEGIDAVYTQLNQHRGGGSGSGDGDEEEGSLAPEWRGDYRDSIDDGAGRASGGWTAERMKPLPVKPLPEKPLPTEPLIDT